MYMNNFCNNYNDMVQDFLKRTLTTSEPRIDTPMKQVCEISIVIPAYTERDYILRPLCSLVHQKNINIDQYEVIIVVNNKDPHSIKKGSQKNCARTAKEYGIYENNQETLRLLRYINNNEAKDVRLKEGEIEIVEKIKKSGLSIHVVDKSTDGLNPANVGAARNRGVAEAIERFYKIGKNGIVVQSDADTSFDKHYLYKVLSFFRNSPGVVGITGETRLEKSEEKNPVFRTASLYSEMDYRYRDILDYIKEKQINFYGANTASRAFETALAGGVPISAGNEDAKFGYKLGKIGFIAYLHGAVTTSANRVSNRTEVGHGQKKSLYAKHIINKQPVMVTDPDYALFKKNSTHTKRSNLEKVPLLPLEDAAEKLIINLCKDPEIMKLYVLEKSKTTPHRIQKKVYKVWSKEKRLTNCINSLKSMSLAIYEGMR